MEPTLLIGDRIFVSKYTYGYSKHSFPFSPKIFSERIFNKTPNQGDLVVFKTPVDNRTDYIKRLIGLPGDRIKMVSNEIFVNNKKIITKFIIDEKYKFIDVKKIEKGLTESPNFYGVKSLRKKEDNTPPKILLKEFLLSSSIIWLFVSKFCDIPPTSKLKL